MRQTLPQTASDLKTLASRAARHYFPSPMKSHRILSIAAALAVAGCATPYKKKDDTEKKEERGEQIRDQSGDTTFQAFVGRLRTAVTRRDRATLTTMMTRDFGWKNDVVLPEETAFEQWDLQNVWPDLAATLREPFQPHEQYMVAVKQTPPRYVAGLRQENGSWRFAYFISAEDAQ
jgi:hypothetical protein